VHSKWGNEPGWFGHVEIPGNSHWDPGSLKYGALFDRARELRIVYRSFQLEQFVKRQGIIRRAVWGARPPTIQRIPANIEGEYDAMVIHHSGRRGRIDPKAIQRMHMDKNHWSDVGFHFMIGPGGEIYEGRSLLFKGAHVKNANTGKIGILVMGDFEREFLGLLGGEPSRAQLAGLTKLGRRLKQLFPGIKTLGGHKDYDKTTICPGNRLYPHLSELRTALGLRAPSPVARH
jgi:peptidoglycan recognition protein